MSEFRLPRRDDYFYATRSAVEKSDRCNCRGVSASVLCLSANSAIEKMQMAGEGAIPLGERSTTPPPLSLLRWKIKYSENYYCRQVQRRTIKDYDKMQLERSCAAEFVISSILFMSLNHAFVFTRLSVKLQPPDCSRSTWLFTWQSPS